MRRLLGLAAAAALALTLVVALPAHAATSYTWTGLGDGTKWGDPQNWSPSGVPSDGDSVSIGSVQGQPSDVTLIPTVSLSSLTVDETANGVYLDGAATSTVTVTQAFSWSGGQIAVPLTIAAGATGVITGQSVPAHEDIFGGGSGSVVPLKKLTVAGTLSIAGIGFGGANPVPTVDVTGRDDIVVAAGGVLNTSAGTLIQSDSCCVDHTATLENFGTISAHGALLLQYLGLDQDGTFSIPPGTDVQFVAGPMRSQGTKAVFSGGGVFELVSTDGDNYDPSNPSAPEFGWKLGTSGTASNPATVTLGTGTVLEFDKRAYLTGVGTITGSGTFLLAGGHIWARVVINVPLRMPTSINTTTQDRVSHVDTWSQLITGEHGQVVLAKASALAAGSSLQIDGPNYVNVGGGASLAVPGTATITSGGCCANPAKLSLNAGATLTLGSSSGTAVIQFIALGGAGHVVLAGPTQWTGMASVVFSPAATVTGHAVVSGPFTPSQAVFTPGGAFVVHGAVMLPGVLVTTTPVTATGAVTVGGTFKSSSGTAATIAGSSITGHFACAYTPGRMPVYGTTKITLLTIGVTDTGCLVYANAILLNGTVTGSHAFSVVLPSTAKRALLKVAVSAATVATTLTITAPGGGSASFAVPKTSALTKYVIVPITSNRTLTVKLAAGSAKMTITEVGSYH
jgi:hypothetical protein